MSNTKLSKYKKEFIILELSYFSPHYKQSESRYKELHASTEIVSFISLLLHTRIYLNQKCQLL